MTQIHPEEPGPEPLDDEDFLGRELFCIPDLELSRPRQPPGAHARVRRLRCTSCHRLLGYGELLPTFDSRGCSQSELAPSMDYLGVRRISRRFSREYQGPI